MGRGGKGRKMKRCRGNDTILSSSRSGTLCVRYGVTEGQSRNGDAVVSTSIYGGIRLRPTVKRLARRWALLYVELGEKMMCEMNRWGLARLGAG